MRSSLKISANLLLLLFIISFPHIAEASPNVDINGDCFVDEADYSAFANLYKNKDLLADFDEDGKFSTNDFIVFLNMYSKNQGSVDGCNDLVLKPGMGFDGPTQQPDPIGSSDDKGYDAKVIGRWDVVPYQDFYGQFAIGIVAFHMNEIDRVEFSVEDGPWTIVHEMTLNPRTSVYEYTAKLDGTTFNNSGLVEVRAIIYPKIGVPRVLAGPILGSEKIDIQNGNHSMFLYAYKSQQEQEIDKRFVWVSPEGSDTEGDGSYENPFRQPAYAARDLNDPHADGGTIYMMPGHYNYGADIWPQVDIKGEKWVTFTSAPGIERSQVIFDVYDGGFGSSANLIHLKNVTLKTEQDFLNSGKSIRVTAKGLAWIEECDVLGIRTENYTIISPVWAHANYVTNNYITDSRTGLRDATFDRENKNGVISGSPFGATPFVVNSFVERYDNSDTDFHGDVFHWFFFDNDHENFIVYNVTANNFDSQGIFAEAMGSNYEFNTIDNVALVNFHVSKDVFPLKTDSGSWWETNTNHLLMYNVSLLEQSMRWKLQYYETTIKNVAIKNSIFRDFNYDKIDQLSEEQNIIIDNNHFTDLTIYRAYKAGTNVTMGNPMFQNRLRGKYDPSINSPLMKRVKSPLIPANIEGHPWKHIPAPIGPYDFTLLQSGSN